MSLPDFRLLRPRTVAEAADMLGRYGADVSLTQPNTKLARGGLQIIAGGTDLVPSLSQKLFEPEYVLDLRGVRELRGIVERKDGGVEIGALTPLAAIEHSPLIAQRYPVLREAAATVASPVIRNMGTLGGNICLDTRCLWYNQSLGWRKSCGFCIKKEGDLCHVAPGGDKCWAAFSGDTPPALLCLDAELEIAGPSGSSSGKPAGARRRVAIRDFYTGVGDARIQLAKNEIVTRVILPAATSGWRGVYRKLRLRGSIDYPLAGVAVVVKANGHIEDARIALTAVNPAPVLVKGIGRLLQGKASDAITEELATEAGELAARTAKPLTTSALTPEYRREMIRVYAKRALLAAVTTS